MEIELNRFQAENPRRCATDAKHKALTLRWDSIAALGAAVRDAIPRSWHRHSAASAVSAMTLAEALDIAAQGGAWPDGAKGLAPIALPESALAHLPRIQRQRPELHYRGHQPCVPAYLSGSPVSMWHMSPDNSQRRIIRLGVQVGKFEPITQAETFKRGSGILSVVDALQAAGHAVEITALWRNQFGESATGYQTFRSLSIECVIKRADQSWSADAVAFALANDAFQRKLCWPMRFAISKGTVLGLDPEYVDGLRLSEVANSYGHGQNVGHTDFDLWVPWFAKELVTDDVRQSTIDALITQLGAL